MSTISRFSEIAALLGDAARAVMLDALMDGRALTASELAGVAGITPQTASGHLARLVDAGLLRVTQQGRHRYHRLASPEVARMVEGIMQVAAASRPAQAKLSVGPRDAALRAARTCYDHLAGGLGVALADALIASGTIELGEDGGALTSAGTKRMRAIGIDIDAIATGRRSARMLCRPCLDWSERRPHLAGALGAALCAHCFDRSWIRRVAGTRAVSVTPEGRRALHATFGVALG